MSSSENAQYVHTMMPRSIWYRTPCHQSTAHVPMAVVERAKVAQNSVCVGAVAARPWTKNRLATGLAEPSSSNISSAHELITTYSGAFTNFPRSANTERHAKSTISAPCIAFVA